MSQAVPTSVEIEVLVSGVTFGPYSLPKAQEHIEEGLLAPTDPARLTHSDQWSTLKDVLEQIPAEEAEAEPEETPDAPADSPTASEEPAPPAETAEEKESPAEEPETSEDPAAAEAKPVEEPEPNEQPPPPVEKPVEKSTTEASEKPSASKIDEPAPISPKTSLLFRPSAMTGSLPLLRPTSTRKGPARPPGGIKSQILARTSQEPLKSPVRPEALRQPTHRLPVRATTSPLPSPASFAPPASAPAPAPDVTSGPPSAEQPVAKETTPVADPGWSFSKLKAKPGRFAVARPKLEEEEEEESDRPAPVTPETAPSLTEKVEPTPSPETAPEENPAAVSPGTRSIPVAALASGSLTVPAPPAAVQPAKPAEIRPAAGADSAIAGKLPARRTQVIKAMPGAAVKGPEPRIERSEKDPSLSVSPVPFSPALPAAPERGKTTITEPLGAPVRSALKPPSESTEPPPAAAPQPRAAVNPIRRRGASMTSALAATTLLAKAGESPAMADPGKAKVATPAATAKPDTEPIPLVPRPSEKSSFQPLPLPKELSGSATASPTVPVVESRRAALRQARRHRRRMGIIYAVAGLILFILLCLGIYHYTTSSHGSAKRSAPSGKTTTNAAAAQKTKVASLIPMAERPPLVVTTNPQIFEHVVRGRAAQAKGDLDSAIGEFTQVVLLDPKYAAGYSYRAAARQAKGDLPGALADDNQFLSLQPNNANGFCQRGFVKQSSKDFDGAVADYSHAITLDPKSITAFYDRGMIEETKNQPDQAIADFNAALDLNPKLAGAYYNRGNAKMTKSDFDGGIADFTSALQIDPKIAFAVCNRGLAEQNLGNLDAALADYDQALALDPSLALAYYNRGLIKEQQDDLDGCIDDSTKALVLDPNNGQAYFNRGVALQAKGNLDAAANDLRKFLELAPRNFYADYAHLYLWVIGNLQNDKSGADDELSTSLQTTWNADPEQLSSKIANFLLNHISESDLMALAVSTDPKKNQIQHCEAWYFDGIKKLLSGDRNAAIGCFHQCVNTGEKDFCEYILAQAQLQALHTT